MVLITNNRVLVDNLRPKPALMCVQRKAQKKIATEEDFIRANIDSFGDDIGKITNRITAMFDVQSKFPKDSEEYKVLDYRIKSGQLFQQNAIDKSKGIISKPMPKEWYDRRSASSIEDPQKRALYLSILSDKKPYFMRYIYPDLMRRYNKYVKNVFKKSLREFALSTDELLAMPPEDLTEEQAEFLKYYGYGMPVGTGDCVTNRICRRFEQEFGNYIRKRKESTSFNYEILTSGVEYSKTQYKAILVLYEDYNARLRDYMIFSTRERVDGDEAVSQMQTMKEDFRRECDCVCSNSQTLCDILLDICYRRSRTKNFVWNMCEEEIINNLLHKNNNLIGYPVLDACGDIEFRGSKFSFHQTEVKTEGVVD